MSFRMSSFILSLALVPLVWRPCRSKREWEEGVGGGSGRREWEEGVGGSSNCVLSHSGFVGCMGIT